MHQIHLQICDPQNTESRIHTAPKLMSVDPIPHMVDLIPHMVDPIPHMVDPIPHMVDPIPHIVDPIPHMVDPIPHMVDPIPHMVDPIPHMVDPMPHMVDPIPHIRIPKSLQPTGSEVNSNDYDCAGNLISDRNKFRVQCNLVISLISKAKWNFATFKSDMAAVIEEFKKHV